MSVDEVIELRRYFGLALKPTLPEPPAFCVWCNNDVPTGEPFGRVTGRIICEGCQTWMTKTLSGNHAGINRNQ